MGKWKTYWRNKGHQTKGRVENFRSLDASQFYDGRPHPPTPGEIVPFCNYHLHIFPDHALVSLPRGAKDYSYPLPVEITSCNYGGQRHWFLCPLPTCKRRSKKLYLYPGGLFLCRKCLNLAYTSQNQSEPDRIINKKWRLIRRYGGDSEWTMKKPKGMHKKTFDQIQAEVYRLENEAMLKIAEMFAKSMV